MSTVPTELLRAMVTEAVREALTEREGTASSAAPERADPWHGLVTRTGARTRTQTIRLRTDEDLAAFTRQLLALFENPKSRADVRNGWLRFSLEGGSPATPLVPASGDGPVSSARRVERGAVTERTVADAAASGQHLLLARAAVLTPLARDKARTLGVRIEKERQ
ncbi:hypothetical protein [Janibacter corallicola]|uniref:hypothetical protein n=1 Tax=Janibacter corallicola TaxID=415212 RepID=UPI00082CA86D|nr:hypothetical protein [Janibacter corallicola]